jgi:hypothetical protein
VQDVVAEADRIGQVLELERVLAQAGHVGHAGQGAERDHDLVEREVDDPGLGPDAGDSIVDVELGDEPHDQLGVRAHGPDRDHDAAWLHGAGGRLGQQRRVEHEVRRVDDGRAGLAEPAGHVAAGETAADHDDAAASGSPGEGEGRSHGREATPGRPSSNPCDHQSVP